MWTSPEFGLLFLNTKLPSVRDGGAQKGGIALAYVSFTGMSSLVVPSDSRCVLRTDVRPSKVEETVSDLSEGRVGCVVVKTEENV